MQFNTKIEKYPIGEPVQTFTSIHRLQPYLVGCLTTLLLKSRIWAHFSTATTFGKSITIKTCRCGYASAPSAEPENLNEDNSTAE